MHDLTRGSIGGHILRLAAPIAAGMVFQTLYFLVDLFFVARLGDAAIAGVGAAANIQFIVMALTQVLGVGTLVLISHAAGRKDQAAATLVYNQSLRDRGRPASGQPAAPQAGVPAPACHPDGRTSCRVCLAIRPGPLAGVHPSEDNAPSHGVDERSAADGRRAPSPRIAFREPALSPVVPM
jgi:hypothetical protein